MPPHKQNSLFQRLSGLQAGLSFLILAGASILAVWVLSSQFGGKQGSGVVIPQQPIRSQAYYQLAFHARDLGAAVYQAAGYGSRCPRSGCRPDPDPFKRWIKKSNQLLTKLSDDPALSQKCQDQIGIARQVLSQQIHHLDSKKAYRAGDSAGKNMDLVLSVCA